MAGKVIILQAACLYFSITAAMHPGTVWLRYEYDNGEFGNRTEILHNVVQIGSTFSLRPRRIIDRWSGVLDFAQDDCGRRPFPKKQQVKFEPEWLLRSKQACKSLTTEPPSRTPSATKLGNFSALKISSGIVAEITDFAWTTV